ncbi:LOW QUALITY PROTEIN: multimerin-1-like [Leucoraja erinacea]|uniref:LOW QUALITY PROTEIN: multimerin-1-like n=1 Tax=Leucoraja erinaceus TaxID=7782 RepID=UPI002454F01B|nr:LOW QUALITY PROTEIN: multimerin-1-like [Leucoraja erinacea]
MISLCECRQGTIHCTMMGGTKRRMVISTSVGTRSLLILGLVSALSQVCCVAPEVSSRVKWAAENGSNVSTTDRGGKLETGASPPAGLPAANRSLRQALDVAGGVSKGSTRQKYPSYSRIGGSKVSFETARGKNWCAYVHTRLSPMVVMENVQTHILLPSRSCIFNTGKCQSRHQIQNQPTYRIKHKIVTSLNWKCCPGYIGADCQPKDSLKRQAEENQAESQRTGADLPKYPQPHYDQALARKFNDKLYNQEIKLGLLQKKVVNISANVNNVQSLLYSLEGKINENNGKDLQSTSKGNKPRGIQELVKDLVSQQIQSLQRNMQETVAELYKTISSVSEELQSTKGAIRELNGTLLLLSADLHPTTVEHKQPPRSELHEIQEQMRVLRADVSLACHNTSLEMNEKHKSLQRQMEGEYERIGALLETMNQTFSLARETPELHLSNQTLQDVPEQDGAQMEGGLQRYLVNITENVKMHGRLILQLNGEVNAHKLSLFNLTAANSQEKLEMRICQAMVDECKSTLGFRLDQVENEVLDLNKTFSDTFIPLMDFLESMNERISNLSYDVENIQPIFGDRGSSPETSTAYSEQMQRQGLEERLDHLSSKVTSLSVFVRSTVGAQLLRNQSQGGEESLREALAECRFEIEDGLNDTMTVINDAVDTMRDDYYILKNNVTDLWSYISEVFSESTVKQNHVLSLLPQFAQLNESFKVLVTYVARHQNALEMMGLLQGIKDTEMLVPPIMMNLPQLLNTTTANIEEFQQRIHRLEQVSNFSSPDTMDYHSRILALESLLSSAPASSKPSGKVKSKPTPGAKVQTEPPKFQQLSRKVSGLQAKLTKLNTVIDRVKKESDQTRGLCLNLSLLLAHVNASVPRHTAPEALPNVTALQQDLREFVRTTSWVTAEIVFTNITMLLDRAISVVARNITKIQKQVKLLFKRPKVINKANITVNSGRSQRYTDKIVDPVESASCVSAPCQNGGTCINQRKGFVCACRPPFGGPSCDIKLLDENAMKTDFTKGSYRYVPMVTFFVAHTYAMNTSGPIRFNDLYVNYGASYAPGSGKFSIPFLGVYVFKYTIEFCSPHLSGYLVVDGVDKLAFQYEDKNNVVSSSRTVTGDAVLELNYGQRVWLRLKSGSIPAKFPPVTTFGGYLLYRT